MRYFDQGAGFSVTVTRREVEAFKRRWPASGLPDRAVTFGFAANGDLVALSGFESDEAEAAAVALAEDARRYGAARHKTRAEVGR